MMEEVKCPHCGTPASYSTPITKEDYFCKVCHSIIPWTTVCENCKKEWRNGDKYCRYCGAPLGTPVYIVDMFPYIYGPEPVIRTHTCAACRFTWETELMIDNEDFCPRCGHPAPIVAEHSCRYSIIERESF